MLRTRIKAAVLVLFFLVLIIIFTFNTYLIGIHYPVTLVETTYQSTPAMKSGKNDNMITNTTYIIDSGMPITFTTCGSTFAPIINVKGSPTISWVFGDGSTSNSPTPKVDFENDAIRTNKLVVTPWSDVISINIGYDHIDGGSRKIPDLEHQNVTAVSGLEVIAPYLQIWASSYNPITTLDFSNFTALTTVECYGCSELSSITLHNVPVLSRLCLEKDNLTSLNLSEAPALADLRCSRQKNSDFTIDWGGTGSNVWHICIASNPGMDNIPLDQFPILKEYYNGDNNQIGTLYPISTELRSVLSSGNHYTSALFPGSFPAGRNASLDLHNNDLTSLDILNDPGLISLDARNNFLNETTVDEILRTLDSYGTNNGTLYLTGNSCPSIEGITYANNLAARGWVVTTESCP
jgi:hypothetical protein